MRVERGHTAVVHHHDTVGLLDGEDALGDNDLRRAWDAGIEGRADGGVGRRVDGRGGVVQHQHFRMLQQGPGDAQALPLAAGDIGAALVDDRVIPIGETLDEFVGAGLAARLPAFFEGGVLLSPAKVVEDRPGEQRALLQDHCDLVPEDLHGIFPDIDATHLHGPFGHVVQAGHQVHEGGFAAAGTTDNANGLTGADVQVDVFQGIVTAPLVGKVDVVEVDAAVRDFRHRVGRLGHVRFLVDHLGDTGRAGRALGELDEDHGQHHQRGEDRHDIAEKRGQLARGEASFHNEMRAPPAQGDDATVDDEVHHRAVQGHQRLRLEIHCIEAEGSFVELGHFVVLPHEGLHHADGIDILLHHAVQGIHLEKDLLEELRGAGDQHGQERTQDDHRDQEDDTQFLMDQETHSQRRNHVQRSPERDPEQHLESTLDAGHVRGHPRDEPGRGEFVDIRKGETLDVLIHRQAQVRREAGAAVGGEPAGQDAEQEAQAGDADHHRPVPVHVRQAPRADALVDDGRRHIRDQHAHDHLQGRPQRGQQGRGLVLPDLLEYGFEHECKDSKKKLSLCTHGIGQEIIVGKTDTVFQSGLVGPAEGSGLGDVQELARGAVRA